MRNRIVRCGTLLILLLAPGCDAMRSDTERTLREFIATANDLSDTLATVRDPQTAEASLLVLDDKYSAYCAIVKRLSNLDPNAKASKMTVDQITRDIANASERLKNEYLRLKNIRGLPLKFWKVVTVRNLEIVLVGLENIPSVAASVPKADADRIHNVRSLIEKCGYEQTVTVEFVNLPPALAQKAFDKLVELAPGATLYHRSEAAEEHAVLGPVKDFRAFVAKLDLGTMTYEDEARRAVKIEVDRRKLGARANSDAEEALLAKQEQREAAEKAKQAAEDSRARAELQRKKLEEEREARAKEAKGPDPSDPDYYDKLADRMTSDNSLYRTKAVDVLVNTDPASVSSAAAKKKIARAFKQLAEGDIAGDRRKAIKGLALWGGKFSVPILLKMLDGRNTAYEEEVLKALDDLKDPQAAPAMAARLGNVRFHQIAFNALNDMGSGAEDALLEVGPSNDATICISAITLLGNVGTAKSIAFLQRAQSTINPAVRTAARSAMQKINARKRQEKADGARSLPGTALESRL